MLKVLHSFKYVLIFLTVFISACSSVTFPRGISSEIYKGYQGDALSAKNISKIKMSKNIEWVEVNNKKILHENFGEITLLPGKYKVRWGTKFAISALLKWSGVDSRTWGATFNLKPGSTYIIATDRSTGPGYNVYCSVHEDDGKTVRNITKELQDGGEISVN